MEEWEDVALALLRPDSNPPKRLAYWRGESLRFMLLFRDLRDLSLSIDATSKDFEKRLFMRRNVCRLKAVQVTDIAFGTRSDILCTVSDAGEVPMKEWSVGQCRLLSSTQAY